MARDKSIRIRVGAALDGDPKTLLKPILDATRDLRTKIEKELATLAKSYDKTFRVEGAKAAEDSARATESSTRRSTRIVGESLEMIRTKYKLLAESAKQGLDVTVAAREAQRELAKVEKAAARAQLGFGKGGGFLGGVRGNSDHGADMSYRMGYWSMRNVSSLARAGGRIGHDLLRGAGFDVNASELARGSVERESMAQALSIQGYKSWADKGTAENTHQDPKAIIADADKAGTATGRSGVEMLGALQTFVNATGDLEGGRKQLEGFGKLANATGADMDDLASAAAAVSVQLDASFGNDKVGKMKEMDKILRVLAAQGKDSSVELKQYAAQMPKVAAAASQFEGGRAEVFTMIGGLVQESKKRGGSTSAALAATSVAGFARDLVKDSGKLEKNFGLNVWANKEKTALANPEKIITAALAKSQGNEQVLRQMFRNSNSYRVVEGFRATYNEAEKQKKGSGLQAVQDEFASFHKSIVSAKDVEDANTDTLKTTRAQAQLFQNKLQETADVLMAQLLPVLLELAPRIESTVEGFGRFVVWASSNPWEAAGALLVASIAKTGIEQGLRAGIETMFKKMGESYAGKNLGALLGIAGAALTIYEVGSLIIESVAAEEDRRQKQGVEASVATENTISTLNHAKKLTPEQVAAAKEQANQLEAKIAEEQAELAAGGSPMRKLFGGVLGAAATAAGATAVSDQGKANAAELADTQKEYQEAYQREMIATIKLQRESLDRLNETLTRTGVKVQPGGPPPRDPAGRAPPQSP